MGTIWIPGAERITPSLPGGEITSTAPPRVVWHTTQNPSGDPRQWSNVIGTLRAKTAEPQVLYDPVTDRLGQFIPLDLSGRALRNDGTTKTNRVGRVCIQVEVLAYAEKPFTDYWKPGPNFRALMAAVRSWGIPDMWPSGPPPKFIADPPHNVPEDERSRTIWLSKAGHYSHSQIPGNDHGDPGAISTPALFAAAPTTPPKGTTPMALTPSEIQAIADAVWAKTLGPSSASDCAQKARVAAEKWADDGTLTQKLNAAGSDVQMVSANLNELRTVVDAIKTKVDTL